MLIRKKEEERWGQEVRLPRPCKCCEGGTGADEKVGDGVLHCSSVLTERSRAIELLLSLSCHLNCPQSPGNRPAFVSLPPTVISWGPSKGSTAPKTRVGFQSTAGGLPINDPLPLENEKCVSLITAHPQQWMSEWMNKFFLFLLNH